MVSLLIYLLVLILIFGVIIYVLRLIPLDEPFRTAAIVVIALIFILILLGMIGVIPGFPRPALALTH